jgi:hypothetical protein
MRRNKWQRFLCGRNARPVDPPKWIPFHLQRSFQRLEAIRYQRSSLVNFGLGGERFVVIQAALRKSRARQHARPETASDCVMAA